MNRGQPRQLDECSNRAPTVDSVAPEFWPRGLSQSADPLDGVEYAVLRTEINNAVGTHSRRGSQLSGAGKEAPFLRAGGVIQGIDHPVVRRGINRSIAPNGRRRGHSRFGRE